MATGDQIKGETNLAYAYFQIYRDMPPDDRDLAKLCDYFVRGKKRQKTVFLNWSAKYRWTTRVNAFDDERRHIAHQTALRRRKGDIDGYYDLNIETIIIEQKIAQSIFVSMVKRFEPDEKAKSDEPLLVRVNPKIFRSAVLGYYSVEQIISRLLGFTTDNSVSADSWTHPGETPLAYQYFQIYRDMMPDERGLEKLCEHSVDGKARSMAVFMRWSAEYNWQTRVRNWDLAQGRYALSLAIQRHGEKIKQILDTHFKILKLAQMIVYRLALELGERKESDPTPDPKAYRQITLAHLTIDQMQARVLGLKEDDEIRELE